MLPIIGLVLPSLIHLAEQVISGDKKGPDKKEFVLKMLSDLYDAKKSIIPSYITKEMVLSLASVLIDALVPKIFPKG